MAYRIDLPKIGQVFTALTIDSACTPQERSLGKYTGVTVGNQWNEIINDDHVALENTYLKLESTTNSTGAVREGYGEIMYNINGTECSTILHLVQQYSAPTDYVFGLKLKADTNEGYTFVGNFQITDQNFFGKFKLTIGDVEVSLDGTMDGPLTRVGDVRDIDLSNSYTVKNESWQLTTTATAADSFTIQIGSTTYHFRPITGRFPAADGRYYMNSTDYSSANVTFHPEISVGTNAIYLYFNVGSLGY